MICKDCRGKGFGWLYNLSLRCFDHTVCPVCNGLGTVPEVSEEPEVARMIDEGCPNDGGEE